jgi:hypothetical protein
MLEATPILTPSERGGLKQKLSAVSGSWQARAIFALLELPKYQVNPRLISSELGISLDDLFYFIDLLCEVGFLVKDSQGKYCKTKEVIDFTHFDLDHSAELESYKSVAAEVLIRQGSDRHSEFWSGIYLSDISSIRKFLQGYKQLVADYFDKPAVEHLQSRVYAIQMSLADLSNKVQKV